MDPISSVVGLADKASEIYSDYKAGKAVRLGSYKGAENTRQLGHYSKSGKHLGIYHG
jgi:hypothetical protein